MKTENIKKVIGVSKRMERLYVVDVEVDGKVVIDDWMVYSGNQDWSLSNSEDLFAFLQCHFIGCNTEEIVRVVADSVGDSFVGVEKLSWFCPLLTPVFGLMDVYVELRQP